MGQEEARAFVRDWKGERALLGSDRYRIAVNPRHALFWGTWIDLNPGEKAVVELDSRIPAGKVVLYQHEVDR